MEPSLDDQCEGQLETSEVSLDPGLSHAELLKVLPASVPHQASK